VNILHVNLEMPHFSTAAPLSATRRTFQPPFTAGIQALNRRMFEDRWIEQDDVNAVMKILSFRHGLHVRYSRNQLRAYYSIEGSEPAAVHPAGRSGVVVNFGLHPPSLEDG
jgi:hypothetical protein